MMTFAVKEKEWTVKKMKVVEIIGDLKDQIEVIEDWYCTDCQEWDCSLCPYDYKGGE